MGDASESVDGVKFLKRGLIPYGMVTGVIAEPGRGKSAFVLYGIVRVIVTACSWWDGTKGPKKPGRVLWCGTENDLAITLQRLKDWNIPKNNIRLPFADVFETINLANDEHMKRLHHLVCQHQTPLVVIDSLRGGHDGDENNSRVGNVLKRLAQIAEETGAAIVVVHHTGKLTADDNGGTEVSARSSRGSNAIIAMFRSLIGVDQPDSESEWCRVRVLKDNLGISPKPFGFRVTNNGLEFGDAPIRPPKDQDKATRKNEAIEWLRTTLPPGEWKLRNDVVADAKQFGLSENALQRAREELGITQMNGGIRKRDDGQYEWKLPTISNNK